MQTPVAKLTDPKAIRRFMLAGAARCTIKSLKTGTRFTYRIRSSDSPHLFFVGVLTGPDNDSNYRYIGTISRGVFKFGAKAKLSPDAPSVVAFKWFTAHLQRDHVPDNIEFWHEGACGRCSRPLTDPDSIARGFGPECIKHVPPIQSGFTQA